MKRFALPPTAATLLPTRELEAQGIARQRIPSLVRRKLLHRVGRGLYRVEDEARITENHSLAEVAARAPKGIICLLSALRFHGLTTQMPHETWIAIDHKARRPHIVSTPVHVVYFSGPALAEGWETHLIEGVPVRIYSREKTIADCFKFRSRLGLDVAVEALRDGIRKGISLPRLERYAALCRVSRLIRPYLEALA